ncbi:MAG: molybdopterin molybdotransferase MoeA [Rhodospirillales bacterium]|nr:molybdopterin molybdotransferase MoeA [Rhodospirillales bacterium]
MNHGTDSRPNKTAALISPDVALSKATAMVAAVDETEWLPTDDAIGRIVAANVVSFLPLPPFDNSAMDGYAVRSAACQGQPAFRFPLAGRIAAGDPGTTPAFADGRDVAIRILTGAAVPQGFDAVIMQEHCELDGEAVLLWRRPVPGDHIRRAGEDVPRGRAIVTAGTLIDPRHVAILAAAGFATVKVRRAIRVAVFSTGTQLRQPGELLPCGQIYDSNRMMLRALLKYPSSRLKSLGAVPDDPQRLDATLRRAAAEADIILSSGGVSVGDEDHMHRLVVQAGGTLEVMKVAIKPGKPMTIGRLGKALYLGLPGNPVSAFVTFSLFGRAVIGKRAGSTIRPPAMQPAICEDERTRSPGRQEYLPVRVVGATGDGLPTLSVITPAGSAMLSSLVAADGFIVIPAQQDRIRSGERVAFIRIAEML